MGDKQGKPGRKASHLRLAYASTAQGGDGLFHEQPRSKPYDPVQKPVDRTDVKREKTNAPYDGQFDVHQVQRQMDAGIEFDHNLDTIRHGVLAISSFLSDPRKQKQTEARAAMHHELCRVALIGDEGWTSKTHDGAIRDLKKQHGKDWKTHYDIHRNVGELRHCTPDGLRDMAVSMLFREQRKDGTLDGAKTLVDFMDSRTDKGLPPPERTDRLYDCPHAFFHNLCSAYGAYNRTSAADEMSNTYAVTQEWPYDWVKRDDHPALLKYMIDRQSCLLPATLEITPKIVKSYFQTPPGFVHGRPLQSDRSIDLTAEFVDTNHPLARLPGHMRHLVDRASHMERADIRHAGRQALEDINRLDFETDTKLRAEMLRLKKARARHIAIWAPPEQE